MEQLINGHESARPRTFRKNIDNFSPQDSQKRVEREQEITSKYPKLKSNVLSHDEEDLLEQTVEDRFKTYPMYEKGQHRPPGSPPERLNIHPAYPRTSRNFTDTLDKRSLQTEANRPFYPTFGTSGGGAPLRNENGEIITNIRSDPETRFQPHKDGNVINEKAFRYIADMNHANEYIRELDDAIKEKQNRKIMEKNREEMLNAMHKRVDYFGKVGGGAPTNMRDLDKQTGVDLHQGYRKTDPVYTDRSVVRHYDLENYTRTGDKWKIPDGMDKSNEYGTADSRLDMLPIEPETVDELHNRKDDSLFLQDTKRTPRNRKTTEVYYPWGRPGHGAPLYNNTGDVETKVAGRLKSDFLNLNWEENNQNRFSGGKREYLNELKSNMVAQERRKHEMEQQQKKMSALDFAEKMRQLDAFGYPKRTANGEIFADGRNLSDISRHKLDVRHPDPLVAKSYHDFLTDQVNEKHNMSNRISERDMQEKKQHTVTMDSYFWKPEGHGAPYAERPHGHRRGKLGSQLHQGFSAENNPSYSSSLPSAGSISQPHLFKQDGNNNSIRMSMATQTEKQYQLQAPFATSAVF